MCVDDYEFRHFTATNTKQCRRFIFTNEDQIQKAFLVNISQFQQHEEVALCKILFHLSTKGLPIANTMFYWPKYNVSIQPGDYCKVPFSALSDKLVFFRTIINTNQQNMANKQSDFISKIDIQQKICVKNIESEISLGDMNQFCNVCVDESMQIQNKRTQSSNQSSNQLLKKNPPLPSQEESYHKRIKEPQRQIGQVIRAVKKWRALYDSKKLNLTKAAKLIGISKKSLDDYYLILRVGQILGFDFSSNMQSKMGDLRAFIRTFNYKVTGKLSKQVECFKLVPDFDLNQIMDEQIQPSRGIQTDINLE